MTKKHATIMMAVMFSGMVMAAPERTGVVYNVPAVEFMEKAQSPTGDDLSTVTVDLLMYERESGYPAVQALVEVGDHTRGIMLRREDVPSSAGVIFGSVDSLWIPYSASVRGTNVRYTRVVDLLDEQGKVRGERVRMFDAAGNPLEDMQVKYEGLLGDHFHMYSRPEQDGSRFYQANADARKPIGTARLLDNGELIVPTPSVPGSSRHGSGGISLRDLRVVEPVSGTEASLASHGFYGHQSQTSVTIPFLNDWNTSVPGLRKFEGRIFRDDGTPAGGVEFQVLLPESRDADAGGFTSVFVAPKLFRAGPDGSFRFVWNFGEREPGWHSYEKATLMIDGSGIMGRHDLKHDEFNEVRTRKTQMVKIELLDENGSPVDLSTTPPVVGDWAWQRGHVGVVRLTDEGDPGTRGMLRIDESGEIQPVKLAVPREYTAQVWHYVFAPVEIGEGDETVQMRAVSKTAEVKARVIDLAGQPVEGAYVAVLKPVIGLNMTTYTLDLMEEIYDRQQAGEEFVNFVVGRTDDRGVANFGVPNMTKESTMLVAAEGFGVLTIRGKLHDSGEGAHVYGGAVDLGDVKLARAATAKLQIGVPDDDMTSHLLARMPASSHHIVIAEFLDNDPEQAKDRKMYRNWETSSIIDDETGWRVEPGTVLHSNYNVPAETTFTLRIVTGFDTTGTRKLEVTEPLAPGEVRDFGLLEVTEPQERLRSR